MFSFNKMGSVFLFVSLILGLFSLTSCSTYSKSDCESFDWNQKGYLSALNGELVEVGEAHYHKECGDKHEIRPDKVQFEAGYKKGLKVFCTPSFATKFGQKGGEYSGICTKEEEKGFLKPYVAGINAYYKNLVGELESEVSSLESENSNLKSEISSLRSENSSLNSDLSSCKMH